MQKTMIAFPLAFLLSILLQPATVDASPTRTMRPRPTRRHRRYRRRCVRKDQLLPLKYRDGGQVWIPKEAACGGTYPVIVLLHGNNAEGDQHNFLAGGKCIDKLARNYLNRRFIEPVILAEPIHHAVCKKDMDRHGLDILWGGSFNFFTYRRLLIHLLRHHHIRVKSWSVIGHSGAGCCPTAGVFAAAKAWRRLKVWATADTCYENPKLYQIPMRRFTGTRTFVYNACRGEKVYPGYRRYEQHMYTAHAKKAHCDPLYYRACVRNPHRRWYSFVTKGETVPHHGSVAVELIKTILWRHFPSRWRRIARRRRLRARALTRQRSSRSIRGRRWHSAVAGR
ncbi:MAG: hypothetical protein J7M25_08105 [Deltaproteobacteria bacterium]|nr:hypothetical protein [Deltaproteobacteria bacterium]